MLGPRASLVGRSDPLMNVPKGNMPLGLYLFIPSYRLITLSQSRAVVGTMITTTSKLLPIARSSWTTLISDISANLANTHATS